MGKNCFIDIPSKIRADTTLRNSLNQIKSKLSADGLDVSLATLIRMALTDWANKIKSGEVKVGLVVSGRR